MFVPGVIAVGVAESVDVIGSFADTELTSKVRAAVEKSLEMSISTI